MSALNSIVNQQVLDAMNLQEAADLLRVSYASAQRLHKHVGGSPYTLLQTILQPPVYAQLIFQYIKQRTGRSIVLPGDSP